MRRHRFAILSKLPARAFIDTIVHGVSFSREDGWPYFAHHDESFFDNGREL